MTRPLCLLRARGCYLRCVGPPGRRPWRRICACASAAPQPPQSTSCLGRARARRPPGVRGHVQRAVMVCAAGPAQLGAQIRPAGLPELENVGHPQGRRRPGRTPLLRRRHASIDDFAGIVITCLCAKTSAASVNNILVGRKGDAIVSVVSIVLELLRPFPGAIPAYGRALTSALERGTSHRLDRSPHVSMTGKRAAARPPPRFHEQSRARASGASAGGRRPLLAGQFASTIADADRSLIRAGMCRDARTRFSEIGVGGFGRAQCGS